MGSDLYFFEQCETRKIARRYRKLPEDLPESLRFAHLNPKVAALLASKERGQKVDSEDPFGDGLGKKSLLPDINAAFQNVRNQFDSALSNDEDSQRYLFEEAKLSASAILRQLAQIIYFYEDLHKLIPKSLEYHLMSGYSEFTNDIVVVPREWQTQEMKEQFIAKQQQEMNVNSEEDLSETEINVLTGRSKSRLGTERSGSEFEKKISVRKNKGKLGAIDHSDDNESILPKSESRQGKRSDSRVSIATTIRQPLDATNISRMGNRRKGSIYGQSPNIMRNRARDDAFSQIGETPSEPRCSTMANPLSYMQTINFQLSNTAFEDKGWIMLKGRQEEVDQSQILEYCVQRLQESLKSMTAQATKEVEQGYDKPVIVRYYGDAKRETLLKYRKSPNKMSPSPANKPYKPKVPSITDERNEGKKLMQASHIDGSTMIYYPSGRPAVMYSAAGFGRPGFYTIVYEDGLDSRMLACFTPSGRGVCYYDNGVVRFLSTEKGGHLAEINGKLIRKWKWPQANVKITEPISFQLNNHIMFRCVGQTQMSFVFSCQREMSRFSVGLVPEADEYKPIEDTDQLLTAFTFSSKAAKDLMRIFAPSKKSKKKSRKKKIKSGEDTKHDVKKQVSFVDQPVQGIGLLPQSPRFNTSRGSVSPDLMRGIRRQSLFPGVSVPSEKDKSDVKDTDSADKRKNLLSTNLKPARRSVSPGPARHPTQLPQQEKAGTFIRKKSPEVRPVSPEKSLKTDQAKTGIAKRESVTPEPHKLNSLGREYCKRKRTQSARKPNIKLNQIRHRRLLARKRERTPEKPVKEEPKLSEESNLFIQTEAYADRWEHKKIADEEARKGEKEAFKRVEEKRLKRKASLLAKFGNLNMGKLEETKKEEVEAFKQAEGKKWKRRSSVLAKVSVLNIKPKDTSADITMKSGGKSHSAKAKAAVVDQECVGKRAQSAQPYIEHTDSSLKGDKEKSGYDQTASVETGKPAPSIIAKYLKKENEPDGNMQSKEQTDNDINTKSNRNIDSIVNIKSKGQIKSKDTTKPKEQLKTDGEMKSKERAETDEKLKLGIQTRIGGIMKSKDKSETSGEIQPKKQAETNSKIVQKEQTSEKAAASYVIKSPKIVLETTEGTQEVISKEVRSEECDDKETDIVEPLAMFRKRGLSLFPSPTIKKVLSNVSQEDNEDDTYAEEAEPSVRPGMFRKRGMSMCVGMLGRSEKSEEEDDTGSGKGPRPVSQAEDEDDTYAEETEPSVKPGMFRRRGISMCVGMLGSSEKAEEEDGSGSHKGRKQSAVMQSIMAFRRNVLKKKGIIESESEEESDEDDSDSVTVVHCYVTIFRFL